MRTFIAIPVIATRQVRRLLSRLEWMGRSIKPVRVDQLHLTLRFLGEVHETALGPLVEAIESAAVGRSQHVARLSELGTFPRLERPGVLWTRPEECEPVSQFEGALSAELEKLGYVRERRPFHPHVTLARIKAQPPVEFFDLFGAAKEGVEPVPWEGGTCVLDRVVLYQSCLTREGPRYVPLATVPLQEG